MTGNPMILDTYDDGFQEILHYDPLTEGFSIEFTADVEAQLDRNKALMNDGTGGWSESREWRRVATIPAVVQMKWFAEKGIKAWDKDHWPAVKRLLNDPEWAYLRTAPGRL